MLLQCSAEKGRDVQHHSLSLLAGILPGEDGRSFCFEILSAGFLFGFRGCAEVLKAAVERSPGKESLIPSPKGEERSGWFPRSTGRRERCCFILSSPALDENTTHLRFGKLCLAASVTEKSLLLRASAGRKWDEEKTIYKVRGADSSVLR